MQKVAVLNVVGLTARMIGPAMPQLASWANGARVAWIKPAFPAVTCTAQANYLTGHYPDTHGIVGNGWYVHEDCEIRFWKQSNKLVQAPKIWETARAAHPGFTCANLFWWFNMYSTADYSVTPRPMYAADGRKLPDVYAHPSSLRDELQASLGTFPLFEFWGPRTSIKSSQWIADAAKQVDQKVNPTLSLVYLPHLDYNLQRLGPDVAAAATDLKEIDDVCAGLIQYFESRGAHVVVLSEYGLCPVSKPVHINRVLREHGLVAVREEMGHELLDPGASAAFAVVDHQIAHVYVNRRSELKRVRAILEGIPGVTEVLGDEGKAERRLTHYRAGDFIAVAARDAWFTYYYWTDDARAADFARTVEIHRKPGYDPAELFVDPAIRVPALSIGWKLAKRKMGFRSLLDVIPLDATLVKGSHGRSDDWSADGPVFISRQRAHVPSERIASVDVYRLLLAHIAGAR